MLAGASASIPDTPRRSPSSRTAGPVQGRCGARRLAAPAGLALDRHLPAVPRAVRDFVYDRVARNRYRWFGRRETCLVPSPRHAAASSAIRPGFPAMAAVP